MQGSTKKIRPNPRYSDNHVDVGELNHGQPAGEELPYQAFAIAMDVNAPETWLLPHHTKLVIQAAKGKISYGQTVDWPKMEESVLLLSRQGVEGRRIKASPDIILAAARHLAGHYSEAGKPLPDAIAVLL